MPLIKPRTRRIKIVSVTCRLEASERDTLADYAKFIHESIHYVVSQLIGSTIARDREFVDWRLTHAADLAAAHQSSDAPEGADAPPSRRAQHHEEAAR
jgi:hypothetical protein